ncbi:uncharacterized protein JCM10292_002609 [Rhodotorula paludigena]|uniref:uncharacterized protein n=1 Tax=Rhodotorula paludigena TaxID=86838 RepID=UPI0031723D46
MTTAPPPPQNYRRGRAIKEFFLAWAEHTVEFEGKHDIAVSKKRNFISAFVKVWKERGAFFASPELFLEAKQEAATSSASSTLTLNALSVWSGINGPCIDHALASCREVQPCLPDVQDDTVDETAEKENNDNAVDKDEDKKEQELANLPIQTLNEPNLRPFVLLALLEPLPASEDELFDRINKNYQAYLKWWEQETTTPTTRQARIKRTTAHLRCLCCYASTSDLTVLLLLMPHLLNLPPKSLPTSGTVELLHGGQTGSGMNRHGQQAHKVLYSGSTRYFTSTAAASSSWSLARDTIERRSESFDDWLTKLALKGLLVQGFADPSEGSKLIAEDLEQAKDDVEFLAASLGGLRGTNVKRPGSDTRSTVPLLDNLFTAQKLAVVQDSIGRLALAPPRVIVVLNAQPPVSAAPDDSHLTVAKISLLIKLARAAFEDKLLVVEGAKEAAPPLRQACCAQLDAQLDTHRDAHRDAAAADAAMHDGGKLSTSSRNRNSADAQQALRTTKEEQEGERGSKRKVRTGIAGLQEESMGATSTISSSKGQTSERSKTSKTRDRLNVGSTILILCKLRPDIKERGKPYSFLPSTCGPYLEQHVFAHLLPRAPVVLLCLSGGTSLLIFHLSASVNQTGRLRLRLCAEEHTSKDSTSYRRVFKRLAAPVPPAMFGALKEVQGTSATRYGLLTLIFDIHNLRLCFKLAKEDVCSRVVDLTLKASTILVPAFVLNL